MLHKTALAFFAFSLSPVFAQIDVEYGGPATPPSQANAPGMAPGGFQGPGFGGPGFRGAPGFPGAGPFQQPPGTAGTPGAQPLPSTAPMTPPAAVAPISSPPGEFRIEFRQPDWREQNFNSGNFPEQATRFAEKAREMGYEVHLEHYRDRSRVGYRMTEWTVYATVYRPERAQQMRSWLEGQGLETRTADSRPQAPATPPTPAVPPYGANGNRPGTQRFSFDPAVGSNGLPQAW